MAVEFTSPVSCTRESQTALVPCLCAQAFTKLHPPSATLRKSCIHAGVSESWVRQLTGDGRARREGGRRRKVTRGLHAPARRAPRNSVVWLAGPWATPRWGTSYMYKWKFWTKNGNPWAIWKNWAWALIASSWTIFFFMYSFILNFSNLSTRLPS